MANEQYNCFGWTPFRRPWTPFTTAAIGMKIGILRYLATRTDVKPHWCDAEGNNTYAYVTHHMQEDVESYEDLKDDFPDPRIFHEVRPGETYARYMARWPDELQIMYAPVLAYLGDELGLNTRSWRNGEEESDEEESEDEESEGEEESDGDESEDEESV